MRKPAFCICENKDADQLRGNREADQRLCFRYIDSPIPLLPKSEISSLYPSSMAVQPGLCGTRSKNPKTGFLTTRLICTSRWLLFYTNISLHLLSKLVHVKRVFITPLYHEGSGLLLFPYIIFKAFESHTHNE